MKEKNISDRYIKRCHKTLKNWNAPLSGWYCRETYDVKEEGWIEDSSDDELFKCELCGCKQVRFVHVMGHDEFYENISVGCVCAGIMDGDILAAAECERTLRNRYNRKKNYLKRLWNTNLKGNHTLKYKNKQITIIQNNGSFEVICDRTIIYHYKNRKITDFLTAVHAAFDLVDQ